MSIRISLDSPPEFYTNLDVVAGRILLALSRPEQIGAIVVKLEGEAKTALAVPSHDAALDDRTFQNSITGDTHHGGASRGSGITVQENHKILYKVQQVFPTEGMPAVAVPVVLQPGRHAYPFRFKVPFNNACSDPEAMARVGGLTGAGGYGPAQGFFGLGGVRVMDGSKQLMYRHVTKTLPPSFTGFPGRAEVRYYIKVTIQRPGLLKENWRYQVGLKFLPIEPPRPRRTNQETYAQRPFTFAAPTSPAAMSGGRRNSLFGQLSKMHGPSPAASPGPASSSAGLHDPDSKTNGLAPPASPVADGALLAPSYKISARLPYPAILTCNQPIPLRLLAEKLNGAHEQVYLVSLSVELVGITQVRSQELANTETTRWIVASHTDLSLPVGRPDDAQGTETPIPNDLWCQRPLPNTVMPSFAACNLTRTYAVEVKIGLSWGVPPSSTNPFWNRQSSKGKGPMGPQSRSLFLPLHLRFVEVYSGIAPPEELLNAMRISAASDCGGAQLLPLPPPRLTAEQLRGRREEEALYPSQLRPGEAPPPGQPRPESAPPPTAPRPPPAPSRPGGGAGAAGEAPPPLYDEAPPSYDEAMAERMTGPAPQERPAYSGVTNENAPSTIPEKN